MPTSLSIGDVSIQTDSNVALPVNLNEPIQIMSASAPPTAAAVQDVKSDDIFGFPRPVSAVHRMSVSVEPNCAKMSSFLMVPSRSYME